MNAEEFASLRAHFDRLCELDPVAQAAALQGLSLAPELREVLRRWLQGDAEDRLGTGVMGQLDALAQAAGPDARLGQRVGAYRIESLLGSGGMGRVYLATREDGRFRGQVALKFAGDDAARRFFLREGRMLARLQHSGIARLLDAGEDAQGCPYLVMEYLPGMALDEYCERQQADCRQRIALVLAAARAVAHAHQLLVLHRDLKPANLLVGDDGELKVLDFGIAKAIDDEGGSGEPTTARYFTLRYAAPEQVMGEAIGTAADVYSLAVVLYELLSGAHPFLPAGADPRQLLRRQPGTDPKPLRRSLAGNAPAQVLGAARLRDLEAVLDAALRRDGGPVQGSMSAFADDLQRVLDDRPVALRRTPLHERGWRWFRRHRLAGVSLLLGLFGLLVGSVLAAWQARLAHLERDVALREAERAERIAGFLTGVFTAPRPIENQGAPVQAGELLDRARERLSAELEDDPLLRAQLSGTLAETYRALGQYQTAEALLLEALAIDGLPDAGLERAGLLLQLGRVHGYQARWSEADSRLAAAAELARAAGDLALLGSALNLRVSAKLNTQQLDAAGPLAVEALQVQQRRQPADQAALRLSEQMLATVAMQRGDLDGAMAVYRQSVERTRASLGEDAVELQMSLNNLAAIELRVDQPQAAAGHYRDSIRIAGLRLGPAHRDQALPQLGLGMALRAMGEVEAAITELTASVTIYQQWDGDQHPATAYARLLLAEAHWLAGNSMAAVEALAEADRVLVASNGPSHGHSCRAILLAGLLRQAEGAELGSEWSAAHNCLADPAAPAALRLLADWASLLRVAPAQPVEAERLSALDRQLVSLKPRDALLEGAIRRWMAARSAP